MYMHKVDGPKIKSIIDREVMAREEVGFPRLRGLRFKSSMSYVNHKLYYDDD